MDNISRNCEYQRVWNPLVSPKLTHSSRVTAITIHTPPKYTTEPLISIPVVTKALALWIFESTNNSNLLQKYIHFIQTSKTLSILNIFQFNSSYLAKVSNNDDIIYIISNNKLMNLVLPSFTWWNLCLTCGWMVWFKLENKGKFHRTVLKGLQKLNI